MECLDDNLASEFVSGSLLGSSLTRVESHLAGCRECRVLVAALAGADDADSNAATHKHERVTESQAGKRPTRTLAIGDRVGRYLVLSTLGAGGMGVVFAAYDPQLDRKVALKLLRANLGANAKDARTRLKREAQAIAQLNHPNVVAVYDVGTTDDDDVYIAMEFVEGDTLTTWLKRWPRTWREILDVFHQAARGLMAAHGVGLLHRDFKPDNVLVGGDGRVRVTDFGLARSVLGVDDATTHSPSRPRPDHNALHVDLTATGTVLGTPRYMPPEQLTGPEIDARSDQFSFCVALYEALFGAHPLAGATSVAMLESGARAELPPEGSRVPAAISRAVMRGLERDRAKRFPTMSSLVHELTPPQQRSPMRFVGLAVVGLVLVGGATAAVMTRPATQRTEPHEEIAVQQLFARIHELEVDRKRLQEQLLKASVDQDQMEQLKRELTIKDDQIRDLIEKVTELRAREDQLVKAVPKLPPRASKVADSIKGAQGDVEGCFNEWAERHPAVDADLIVKFAVTPAGLGKDALAQGTGIPEDTSLKICVADAIARIHYPKGPDQLDLEVQVDWMGGNLAMSGFVKGFHEAASGTLDGI